MKTDVWVKRLNNLTREMQEIEDIILHSSAWKELMTQDKFIKLEREINERIKLSHLGAMRIWTLKKRISKHEN